MMYVNETCDKVPDHILKQKFNSIIDTKDSDYESVRETVSKLLLDAQLKFCADPDHQGDSMDFNYYGCLWNVKCITLMGTMYVRINPYTHIDEESGKITHLLDVHLYSGRDNFDLGHGQFVSNILLRHYYPSSEKAPREFKRLPTNTGVLQFTRNLDEQLLLIERFRDIERQTRDTYIESRIEAINALCTQLLRAKTDVELRNTFSYPLFQCEMHKIIDNTRTRAEKEMEEFIPFNIIEDLNLELVERANCAEAWMNILFNMM